MLDLNGICKNQCSPFKYQWEHWWIALLVGEALQVADILTCGCTAGRQSTPGGGRSDLWLPCWQAKHSRQWTFLPVVALLTGEALQVVDVLTCGCTADRRSTPGGRCSYLWLHCWQAKHSGWQMFLLVVALLTGEALGGGCSYLWLHCWQAKHSRQWAFLPVVALLAGEALQVAGVLTCGCIADTGSTPGGRRSYLWLHCWQAKHSGRQMFLPVVPLLTGEALWAADVLTCGCTADRRSTPGGRHSYLWLHCWPAKHSRRWAFLPVVALLTGEVLQVVDILTCGCTADRRSTLGGGHSYLWLHCWQAKHSRRWAFLPVVALLAGEALQAAGVLTCGCTADRGSTPGW